MTYTINIEGWRPFTVSERKVVCRKATMIGYGRLIARPGYWITFTPHAEDAPSVDRGVIRIGRVLGRIEAPHDAAGWLYVLALSPDGTSLFPVWVNPDWVSSVQDHERLPATLLAWFTQPQLPRPDIVAKLARYGSLSVNYIDRVAERQWAFEAGVSPEGAKALERTGPDTWPDDFLRAKHRDAERRVFDTRTAWLDICNRPGSTGEERSAAYELLQEALQRRRYLRDVLQARKLAGGAVGDPRPAQGRAPRLASKG